MRVFCRKQITGNVIRALGRMHTLLADRKRHNNNVFCSGEIIKVGNENGSCFQKQKMTDLNEEEASG